MLYRFAFGLRFLTDLAGGAIVLGTSVIIVFAIMMEEPFDWGTGALFIICGLLVIAAGRGLCWVLFGRTSY